MTLMLSNADFSFNPRLKIRFIRVLFIKTLMTLMLCTTDFSFNPRLKIRFIRVLIIWNADDTDALQR